MEIKVTPKNIFILLVFLWVVFSIVYIGHDILMKYKNLEEAYNQGTTDTVHALIQEAEKCQPFSVYVGDKKIELIKTDCDVKDSE